MSFDVNWDIESYREEHESDEHWQLRRVFMERWKTDYSEERLVCLARVFANMELLGCRYPVEVMQEVARLSHDVAQDYRKSRKNKLQRTFVSASDAAEDRAKGVKREGGIVVDSPQPKSNKISFIPQGATDNVEVEKPTTDNIEAEATENIRTTDNKSDVRTDTISTEDDSNYVLSDMAKIKCLNIRSFHESMFESPYGRMILLIRPWITKYLNIQASCQVCNIALDSTFDNGCFSLLLNGVLVAQSTSFSKADAKNIVETIAWNRLKQEMISVVVKQQFIAQGDTRISVNDVAGRKEEFGTPIENSVATKMMKLMGWKGGGLGADAQGIAEPIKPNLQMVNRSGLGSHTSDIRNLRRAAQSLMQRYIASDALDLDLVFSSEFNKEERAALHQCAQRAGLKSKSYGDADRFLVVNKKLDPFSLVRAVIEKGGNTPKYQVFIPAVLDRNNGR